MENKNLPKKSHLNTSPLISCKISQITSNDSKIITNQRILQSDFASETQEPEFAHTCKLCNVIPNHNDFRFSLFPDKTSDSSLRKVRKAFFFLPFWAIFTHFCENKNITGKMGCHFFNILSPNFMQKIWKTSDLFQRKMCYTQTDTDRQYHKVQ